MKKKKTNTSTQMEQVKYLIIGILSAVIFCALYYRVFSLSSSLETWGAKQEYILLVNQVKKMGIGQLHAQSISTLAPDERIAGGTMTGKKLHPGCLAGHGYFQFKTNRSFEVIIQEYKAKLQKNGWEYYTGMAEFRNVHYFVDPGKQMRLEIFQTSQQDKPLGDYLYAVNFEYGHPLWASCYGV